MTLTINCDASYYPQHKVAGYAFWIVCEAGRLIQSGPLKQAKDSHTAEVQAIGNALAAVLKSDFKNVQFIVVNTDCQYAINAITKGTNIGKAGKAVKVIHGIIEELKVKHNVRSKKHRNVKYISWRYVQSHSEGDTKREWVNNRMDSMAKQAALSLIKKDQEVPVSA